jgi:eukaryotic-like serine/threonine-protein kinase
MALVNENAPIDLTPPFVLGPYHIVARIGKGGMGVVFRAVHAHLRKQVAIKILSADSMADPLAVARFQRELVAIGRLDHHNIVRATDGGHVNGVHFLAMDFIEGIDLARLLRLQGRLSLADACALVYHAANGLQYVHEHRLVHRDIKPGNLLLSVKGELKILDLGLALLHHGEAGHTELTARGLAMGTYDYMAPEQWQSSHDVDIRADIYSLGCTLYTLLVGRPPFSGPGYEAVHRKMVAHLEERLQPVTNQCPEVPLPLEELLQRMLAKNPPDRPATPADVADALEPFLQGADLVQLARQAVARHDGGELDNRDHEILPGDLVTVSERSTAVKLSVPAPSTQTQKRRSRQALAVTGFLGLAALLLVLILQPWSWNVPKSANPQTTNRQPDPPPPGQGSPPEVFAPGVWHDLLERPPTEIVWPVKRGGVDWKYDADSRSIWANCDEYGLLALGTVPGGRYDLEVEISEKIWTPGVGLFFRGREAGRAEKLHVEAEAVILAYSFKQELMMTWGLLNADPRSQKGAFSERRAVLIALPKPGRNKIKLTVDSDGLVSAFWNEQPVDSKICLPEPNHIPRVGSGGSFGICLTNTTATICSARLFIHP